MKLKAACFISRRHTESLACAPRSPGSGPDCTWHATPENGNCEHKSKNAHTNRQGCISCGMCSYPELTKDHVLTSAYVNIFRTVTRNAVNKSVWRKKDCFWLPLNKHAMNIWLSSLRIRAHLSWRTGKHLHVLHVLRTYPTCSYPGYQDTTTYAALGGGIYAMCNMYVGENIESIHCIGS